MKEILTQAYNSNSERKFLKCMQYVEHVHWVHAIEQ